MTIPVPANFKLAGRGAYFRYSLLIALLLCATSAHAQESVTINFPLRDSSQGIPSGFLEAPSERSGASGTVIEIPLVPVSVDTNVYVTIIFRDQPNTVLGARWVSDGARPYQKILAENIMEGIQGWNQRTLEIPYGLLEEPGSILLEADSEFHTVKRIVVVWAYPNLVYSSGTGQTISYVQNARKGFSEGDFADLKKRIPLPDSWADGVWKAVLQEHVEKLEEGIAFVVPIDASPIAAVFRAKVLGAPVNATVSISVNGHQLPPISLEVPELTDPGYMQDYNGDLSFAGWREASIAIPFTFLRKEDNSIVIEPVAGSYLKGSMLELKFEEEMPIGGSAENTAPIDLAPSLENLTSHDGVDATLVRSEKEPIVITVPQSQLSKQQ